MYKDIRNYTTCINCNTSTEGESIETMLSRITTNREPIKDSSPIIYMERKDGIKPEYDIRTDKFDNAIDKIAEVNALRIERRKKDEETKNSDSNKSVEVQGTEPPPDAA